MTTHMDRLKQEADDRKRQRASKAAWNAETKRVRAAREARIADELRSKYAAPAGHLGTLGQRLKGYGL